VGILLRHGADRRALRAFRERQELVKAGLTRRDLVKLGVLTTGGVGGGLVFADKSLAAGTVTTLGSLPPLKAFDQDLRLLEALPERDVSFLDPAPTPGPNPTVDPATRRTVEGRSEDHQSQARFGVDQYFQTRMAANPKSVIHPALPAQTFWGFNKGGADLSPDGDDPPLSPGPILVMHYLHPLIVRRYNQLPPANANGGFGVPEVSTHLHNFHSGPDSDGGPCDPVEQRFFFRGQFYDYYHNLRFAGWDSTNPPDGNIQEALGFLWYHDHRVDHTAENTYKGLVGPAIAFNAFDTGDEGTGFFLPQFPDFDIPLVLADKLIDPTTGLLVFDTFSFDGLLGNTFLVNGRIQPTFEVKQRRYRFRVLDGGPSRFYEFFLTNPDNLQQKIPFFVLSDDGNLLPRPIQTLSYRVGVAERTDIIVDFKKIADRFGAKRLILENRLQQLNGRGPTGTILAPGQGDALMQFELGAVETDDSFDPEPVSSPTVPAKAGDAVFAPISLPDISNVKPRITRTFSFERGNGQWKINGKFMDCTVFRFQFQRNTAERWIMTGGGGWQHPVHIHFEEFRILSRNGRPVRPGDVEFARKDVFQLRGSETVELLIRFRDMVGGYPVHCHNTVHEDHQMMLLFNVGDRGDNKTAP
jgi:FtsP/CotA-like multicopper oxidase with cupredoxin domain